MSKLDLLKQVSQPVKALTNPNGVISNYLRLVDQLLRERNEAGDSQSSKQG